MAVYNERSEQLRLLTGMLLSSSGFFLCETLNYSVGLPEWFYAVLLVTEALCLLFLGWTGLRAIYPQYLCPAHTEEGSDVH